MTRIIVHAGFHKTGTSSLQAYLRENRSRLGAGRGFYFKEDFLEAGNRARIYGLKPFPWRLWQFRRAFRAFLAAVPDLETIVLSWECFSGVMPGHRRIFNRLVLRFSDAAIPLSRVIVDELRRRFGARAEIAFVYTTRAPDSWIASVYGHLCRSIRIKDDFAGFVASFPTLPNLEEEAALISSALQGVSTRTYSLERCQGSRFGPALAILDMLDLSQETLGALPDARAENTGLPDEAVKEFLVLNKSVDDRVELKQRKEKIARYYRSQVVPEPEAANAS